MKNLDQSINNQSILDDSFYNASGGLDYGYIISELKSKLDSKKSDLKNFEDIHANNLNAISEINSQFALGNYSKLSILNSIKSYDEIILNKISTAKSAIDDINSQIKKYTQESIAQRKKDRLVRKGSVSAKTLVPLSNIELSEGKTVISNNYTPRTTSDLGNSSVTDSKNVDSKEPIMVSSNKKQIGEYFTTKNIVIGISVLALAVGGFFLVKKIIKK